MKNKKIKKSKIRLLVSIIYFVLFNY